MTPAELLKRAEYWDMEADNHQQDMANVSYDPVMRRRFADAIADLRLAARLARFAAERGGLEEEK